MKKVYKGWVDKNVDARHLFEWGGFQWGGCPGCTCLYLNEDIYPTKGTKKDWGHLYAHHDDQSSWPPKRITITVEIED